ncbi:hypothetical protein [Paraflavitalea sp. CAU 1676]|uniref:anti-sigma factor family protein n=1 Tax=Paraflavitalea sp. CAU 1676 TaxID=3032598 RepID=UPI0023DB7F9B|nr:hypothetical protein [Paraflavitalea sp. CAU 1676]MDF2186977.1 hypothetical protein [Paraflavitalea sp. CAU 1676]
MNITRQNYEEYFLLYVDNELNIVQRKAVESFVEENPDLRAELIMLQDTVLPSDDQIVFQNKGSLLRTTAAPNPVNDTNCEEYFILYADDELTNEQKDQVEQFVYRNPQHQASFELMQQVKLMPDTSVVFPDKYALYRHEEEEKTPVVGMRWYKMAAAAAVLLFVGGMGWYMATTEDPIKGQVARDNNGKQPQTTQPATTTPSQQSIAATDAGKNNQAANPGTDQSTANPAVKENTGSPAQEGYAIKKEENKRTPLTPAVRPQEKSVQDQELAALQSTQKKDNNKSNILPEQNVQQEKGYAAINPAEKAPNKVELKGQDPEKTTLSDPTNKNSEAVAVGTPVGVIDLAVNNKTPNKGYEPLPYDESPENNKKNRMRGFFRKVSRVFDKATSADPDQEKSSIRIASFEIALK